MAYLNIFCASGGGSKGAFQGGTIEALTRSGIHLDGFVGVSTGSIQTGYMSLAKPGLEAQWQQLLLLKDLWFSLKDASSILSKPCLGYLGLAIRVIGGEPSLYSLDPLKKLLAAHIRHEPRRPLRLGVVHLDSGEFRAWEPEDALSLQSAILASASIPFVFPPVPNDLVDGGVREIAPLAAAFELAGEFRKLKGFDPANDRVRIFLSLASPIKVEAKERGSWEKAGALEVALRSLDILEGENYYWDLQGAKTLNELVRFFDERPEYERPACLENKLYADLIVIEPDRAPYSALEFDPLKIRGYWQHGVEKTLEVLAKKLPENVLVKKRQTALAAVA
jgi:predicted acylesterase/phospholipase RssA